MSESYLMSLPEGAALAELRTRLQFSPRSIPNMKRLEQYSKMLTADTADSIRASSPLGRSACPVGSDPQSQPVAECQGLTEVAQLPGSGDLVVTQYFDQPSSGHASGGLLILDPTGNILAHYTYPNLPGPNGTSLSVHPREVEADPTRHAGDERFAVVFDV